MRLLLQPGQPLKGMHRASCWSVLSVHCFHHFGFSLLQLVQILPALPSRSRGPLSAGKNSVSPGTFNFSLNGILRAFTFGLETFCSFVHKIAYFIIFSLFIPSSILCLSLISPRREYMHWKKGPYPVFALLLPFAPRTLLGVRHLEGFPNWD